MTAPTPSPVTEQISRAERLLELIAPKLELVEEELRRNFQSQIRTISDVGEHILGGGGKRLRPALLLLVSQDAALRGISRRRLRRSRRVHPHRHARPRRHHRRGRRPPRPHVDQLPLGQQPDGPGRRLPLHALDDHGPGRGEPRHPAAAVERHDPDDRGRDPRPRAERPRRSHDRRLLRDRRPEDRRALRRLLPHPGYLVDAARVDGRRALQTTASTSASASSSSTTCSTSPRAPRSSASRRCPT